MGYKEHFILALAVTGFCTLILGIITLLQGKKLVSRIFGLYSLSISWWALTQIGNVYGPTLDDSFFWAKVEQCGVIFIPTFFLHFTAAYLGHEKRGWLIPCYLFSTVVALFSPTTNLIASGAEFKFGLFNFGEPGILYPLLLAYFVIASVFGLGALFRRYFSATGLQKIQLGYICWPSMVGYIGGGANFLLVYDISLYPLNPFGTYLVAFYTISIGYAIAKYRFMNIALAITRTSVFMAVYTLILGLPLLVALSWRPELEGRLGINWWVWLWIVCALLSTAAHCANQYLQRRAENRLRAEEMEAHWKLRQISQNMMRFTKLETLLGQIVHSLVKTLKLTHAAVYMTEADGGPCKRMSAWAPDGQRPALPESIPRDSALVQDLTKRKIPRVREELKLQEQAMLPDWRKLVEEMGRLEASVVIPAFKQERFYGFLVLGEKRSGRIWTQDDLNLLMVLANQAALAIENAQLHKAEEDRHIKEAIDQTTAQIAHGVGHQFNNVLNNLGLLADKILWGTRKFPFAQWLSSVPGFAEFWQQTEALLKQLREDALRAGGIARGVLGLSDPIPQEMRPVEIPSVIEQAANSVLMERSHLTVGHEEVTPEVLNGVPKDLPKITGSEAQIHQCFYNLIDNGIDAIRDKIFHFQRGLLQKPERPYQGRIQITAQREGERLVITLSDDGIGVKEEDKPRLFMPYFTTKGPSKGRGKEGHGLGLYVIKRVIEEGHGGKIRADSEFGKGTRFTIELPIHRKGGLHGR